MKILLVITAILMCSVALYAETMKESIVARIDNTVIFQSDIIDEFRMMGKSNPTVEEQKAYLDGIIKNKILYLEAIENKDIKISSADIEQEVDKMIDKMKTSMGGDSQFAQALASEGLDLNTLRSLYRKKIKEEMYIQEYIEAKIKPSISVSEEESEVFFKENKSLFKRSATYEYEIGMVPYEFGGEDEKRIVSALSQMRDDILKKKITFQEAARKYSQDGSAANGGDLGYLQKGQMVKEFETVAFSLLKGEVSKPFKSPFGYHLAYVDEIKGDTRKVYHIIILPSPPQDKMAAFEKNIKDQGSWENVKQWGNGTAMKFMPFGPIEKEKINPMLNNILENTAQGQISSPFFFNNAILVLYVKNKSESKELTYVDVKQRIKYILMDRKMKEYVDKMYEKLKSKYFIEILL